MSFYFANVLVKDMLLKLTISTAKQRGLVSMFIFYLSMVLKQNKLLFVSGNFFHPILSLLIRPELVKVERPIFNILI